MGKKTIGLKNKCLLDGSYAYCKQEHFIPDTTEN